MLDFLLHKTMAVMDPSVKGMPAMNDTNLNGLHAARPPGGVLMRPAYVLAIILACNGSVEIGIMLILEQLPALSEWQSTLLDGFLLTLIVSPIFYYLLFLPLKQRLIEQERSQQRLHALMADLHQAKEQAEAVSLDLREREKYLSSILENSLDAIITTDQHGQVVGFNAAAERLFLYDRTVALGRNIEEMIILPAWRARHRDAMARRLEQMGAEVNLSRRVEVPSLRGDGTIMEIQLSLTAISRQEKPYFIAFIQDVTERKRLMESLNEALVAAESSNKAKSEFLANMSHEIRTPMNGVLGMIDLALDAEPSEQVRDFLSYAKTSSRLLLRVINDILDYSRIESGKLTVETVEFCLDNLLRDAIHLFQPVATDKSLAWRISMPPQSLGPLLGDRIRIQQVLVNLLGNAVKFTAAGEILLQVVVLEQTDERVRLEFSVKDTGIGLTEAQIGKLFSPFVQADSSTTRKFGGTGLGLTICKRLVEMMGGEIGVSSTPHVGSTFHFTVPLGRVRQSADAISLPTNARHGLGSDGSGVANSTPHPNEVTDRAAMVQRVGGTQVLLVEDNLINQRVVQEMLERMEIQVTLANHGQEAIEILENRSVDLVLMDVQMPVMDGYQATRTLRAMPRFATIPIIALTAHALTGDRQKCLAAGMNDYIVKPIALQGLFCLLTKWIKPPNHPMPVLPPLAETAKAVEQPSPQAGMEDLPGLDVRDILSSMEIDLDFYQEMLRGFRETYQQAPEAIRTALLVENDPDAGQRQVHTIQGVAGNLGAQTVQALASELEAAIVANQRDRWPSLLEQFAQAMAQVLDSIASLEEKTAPPACQSSDVTEVDWDVVMQHVNTMAHWLQKGNVQAIERLEPLRLSLAGASMEQALSKLERALDQFDFQTAIQHLEPIAKQATVAKASITPDQRGSIE